MSQSILRKRKMKNIFKQDDLQMIHSKLFQKKSIDFRGQTQYDYSQIVSQIQIRYPQIPQDLIKEILSKNEDDILQVMSQVQSYVKYNNQNIQTLSDKEMEQKKEIMAIKFLVANPSNQNMINYFTELQKEVKEKFNEKESDIYKKTQATNIILKEAVKIQKSILDETKQKEKIQQNEISKIESQIQQIKIRKQILKEQIESFEKQPQLIQ